VQPPFGPRWHDFLSSCGLDITQVTKKYNKPGLRSRSETWALSRKLKQIANDCLMYASCQVYTASCSEESTPLGLEKPHDFGL
jgi:hypothetical protein